MRDQVRFAFLQFVIVFCCVNVSFGQSSTITYESIAKQDTVYITLKDAEKIMLEKNLDLIANHFNIDIAHAQVISAKLWDNLTFDYQQNIWNPTNHIPFSIKGPDGEVFLQIDQVFKTAGKRHRLVKSNMANEKAAEYAYYDLLRNLKFQFRSDFYQLNALLKTQKRCRAERSRYDTEYHVSAADRSHSKSVVDHRPRVRNKIHAPVAA